MEKTKFGCGKRFVAALLIVLICGLLVAGATMDWGKVHYSRITFLYSNYGNNNELGTYEGSAILMVPDNATKETPAPGVFVVHGISSAAHSMSNYAIELCRRGYVVMMVDLPGSGYTDMVGQNPPTKQDMTTYLDCALAEFNNLNFVQKGNMTALGFSGGVKKAVEVAVNHKDMFNCVIAGSGETSRHEKSGVEGLNLIGITSAAKNEGQPAKVSGSVADGTYRADYYFEKYVTHVWMTINSESMFATCHYLNEVNPAPKYIDANDQTFIWAHIFSVGGYLGIILFLVSFVQVLLKTKFFASLQREPFAKFETNEPKWLKLVFMAVSLIFGVVAMLLFVVELRIVPLDVGVRAIPLWFNVYIPYFIALGIFELLMFLFRFHFRVGKKQGGNLTVYRLWTEGGVKAGLANAGKALLLGLINASVIYAVLMFIEINFGVIFNFFDFSFNIAPAKLLVHSWFYILMYLFLFTCSNLNSFVASSEQDGSTLDTIKSIAFKTVISILPMLILVGINLGRGMGIIPGKTNVPMDHLYGYIFMISLGTIVNNIVTKKTKNILVGAAVCACFMGFAVTFGYALQATMFG